MTESRMRLRPFYVGLAWFNIAMCLVGSLLVLTGSSAWWMPFWVALFSFQSWRLVLHYRAPKPAPAVDRSDRAALEADLFRPVSEWVAEAEAAAVRKFHPGQVSWLTPSQLGLMAYHRQHLDQRINPGGEQ